MPRKSYRTLKLCIALHRIIVRERAVLEQTEKRKKQRETKLFCRIFLFLVTGSGTRSRPPLGAEAAGRSESLPAFNTALFLANGTRELRTGSRSVPQYGTRIRAIALEMGGECTLIEELLCLDPRWLARKKLVPKDYSTRR